MARYRPAELTCMARCQRGTVIGVELYEGAYTVHSAVHEAQELPTANKQLTKNITVEKIPYYETSNMSDGITIYIGDEREVEIYE